MALPLTFCLLLPLCFTCSQVVERVLNGQQFSPESAAEFSEHVSAQAVSTLSTQFEGFRFAGERPSQGARKHALGLHLGTERIRSLLKTHHDVRP